MTAPIRYAAVGTDGVRPVVWGLGSTERKARAECADGVEVYRITPAQAAVVEAGDVSWPIVVKRPGRPNVAAGAWRSLVDAAGGVDALAARLNASRRTVHHWCAGTRSPSRIAVAAIERAAIGLGVASPV